MPITPTYPGVYIQELPSPVKTIVGVSTSITAFIGRAWRGPVDQAKTIHSFSDFIRTYGGLWEQSSLSYAVFQYFQNGGQDAVIIRSHNDAKPSTFSIGSLKLEAANPGSWGDDLEIIIEPAIDNDNPSDPDETLFKLTVELVKYAHKEKENTKFPGKSVIASEVYQKVSTDEINNKSRFIKSVLDKKSELIKVPADLKVEPEPPTAGNANVEANVETKGSDGEVLKAEDIFDENETEKSLGLLEKVDLFNMLCIPQFNDEPVPKIVYDNALAFFCKPKRAMLIVDPPWDTKDDAVKRIDDEFVEKDPNAAVWFPRIEAPDPLDKENKSRLFPPCGAIAGIIARTDTERGVWKAPAGIEASLVGVSGLEVKLTDKENGDLNPLGINCLRIFPDIGIVSWGARTLRGADRLTDQWKYLPVRRTALYIEESLYRGTQWVVFEPNDERLWGQIRLNVGAFMHDLFRKGAFQGSDPSKAYFVKCDSETTTQFDIDRGIVNIVVGFAPLKPAEFVIIQIQQLTQQEAPA